MLELLIYPSMESRSTIDQTDKKKRQGEAADTHYLNTCFPNVLDFGRDQGNTFIWFSG